MTLKTLSPVLLFALVVASAAPSSATERSALVSAPGGYILARGETLEKEQPGPHGGGGKTTAFDYFSEVNDCGLVFRKRVLHPGSSIGNHLQKADEIYYVVSGRAELTVNGKILSLEEGDAVLTRPGSTHAIKPADARDLVLIVAYLRKS